MALRPLPANASLVNALPVYPAGTVFFGVRNGHNPGVFLSADESGVQVDGYSRGLRQSFKKIACACAFVWGPDWENMSPWLLSTARARAAPLPGGQANENGAASPEAIMNATLIGNLNNNPYAISSAQFYQAPAVHEPPPAANTPPPPPQAVPMAGATPPPPPPTPHAAQTPTHFPSQNYPPSSIASNRGTRSSSMSSAGSGLSADSLDEAMSFVQTDMDDEGNVFVIPEPKYDIPSSPASLAATEPVPTARPNRSSTSEQTATNPRSKETQPRPDRQVFSIVGGKERVTLCTPGAGIRVTGDTAVVGYRTIDLLTRLTWDEYAVEVVAAVYRRVCEGRKEANAILFFALMEDVGVPQCISACILETLNLDNKS